MDSKPLVVRVEDINTRQAWLYLFTSGPVWVGCGTEASLLIVRPFISPQHGCFRFDHHSVHYQDLDPGVATLIDGDPAGGKEVPLTEWSQMEMGDLRVTISRVAADGVSDPSLSPFARPLRAPEWSPGVPPNPELALPRTLVLPDTAARTHRGPSRSDAWSEIVEPDSTPAPSHRRSPSAKPARRQRRGRVKWAFRRALAWLSAVVVGVGIIGVAGLMLQYRGLPWIPPELASRIPAWLANLFR
jgi:hypothetical protein